MRWKTQWMLWIRLFIALLNWRKGFSQLSFDPFGFWASLSEFSARKGPREMLWLASNKWTIGRCYTRTKSWQAKETKKDWHTMLYKFSVRRTIISRTEGVNCDELGLFLSERGHITLSRKSLTTWNKSFRVAISHWAPVHLALTLYAPVIFGNNHSYSVRTLQQK